MKVLSRTFAVKPGKNLVPYNAQTTDVAQWTLGTFHFDGFPTNRQSLSWAGKVKQGVANPNGSKCVAIPRLACEVPPAVWHDLLFGVRLTG